MNEYINIIMISMGGAGGIQLPLMEISRAAKYGTGTVCSFAILCIRLLNPQQILKSESSSMNSWCCYGRRRRRRVATVVGWDLVT